MHVSDDSDQEVDLEEHQQRLKYVASIKEYTVSSHRGSHIQVICVGLSKNTGWVLTGVVTFKLCMRGLIKEYRVGSHRGSHIQVMYAWVYCTWLLRPVCFLVTV